MLTQAASGGDSTTTWKIIVSTSISFAIATAAVILRFGSRWLRKKDLETNDYLIIIAFLFKLGIDIGSVLLIKYGIGKDLLTLSPSDVTKYLQVLYIGPLFYAGAIGFTKCSILALYWSAFPTRLIRWSVYALVAVVTAWTIAVIVVALDSCDPVRKAWHPLISGECINYKQYYYGFQIPNVITDFLILFLPLKAVLDLHLPRRQSFQISAVLMLAVVTCAFDIVRLVVLINLNNTGNFTKHQVGLSIWTDLEPSVAILVACLPIMRPLLHPRRAWRTRNEPESQRMNSDLEDDESGQQETKADYDLHSDEMSSNASPSRNL